MRTWSTPADAGFPRSRRLLSGAQFRRVFQGPERRADAWFSVAARRSCPEQAVPRASRLGLAISRKSLPRAIDRNRVKRIVREAFRRVPWPCSIDVVVVGRAGLRGASNAVIRGSIAAHFDSIGRRLCGARLVSRVESGPP